MVCTVITLYWRKETKFHKNIKYPCTVCDFEATYKENLATHVLAIHERKRFNCDTCDADFSTKSNYTETMHKLLQKLSKICDFETKMTIVKINSKLIFILR